MTRKADLIALRDAVQAGEAPNNDLVWNALSANEGIHWSALHVLPAFEGSVDAALAFFAAVLPGWVVGNIGQGCADGSGGWHAWLTAPDYLQSCVQSEGKAETPARALLLATLNALIAEADT